MDTNYLDLIIDIIINNTKLSYCDKNKLTIDNESPVLEVIKVIAHERYELRVNELNQKEEVKE